MPDHSTPTQYDPSSPGGVKSRLIFVLFVTCGVLLAVILSAVEAGFHFEEDRIAQESYARGNPALETERAAQEARLNSFARIKGDPDHVVVPVAVAIDDFVARHGGKR